ncbi:MAG: hypothetical protein GY758_16995 [Fuerstiella sp.]|nr:hypothetical protein [Fuerstiella sp.]MCP4506596.1 hypothetical protein [Fuerstiella sp.]MCP4783451.1 hypothetical protein [Fuerstiella sp.]MCP4857715.1 hypothetical protein [Fuerstiella sp.]
MRRVLTTAVALIIAFSVTAGSEAEAGKRRASRRASRATAQSTSNGGFFARVMEVERRKNAWLRANFTRG